MCENSVCRGGHHSPWIRQVILLLTESEVGLPLLSIAGVNRARLRMILQVAASSADEPLELVTVQLVTRPLEPTSSRKPVVPSSSERSAEAG
jgi:hypothetical protein